MDTKSDAMRYICGTTNLKEMEIVSARDFRSNQSSILAKVKEGVSVLLTSRMGTFKILPVTEEDCLTSRIREGLKEVKATEAGRIEAKSARDFLNEL